MLFEKLDHINSRPQPFEFYTASDLWTDEYTSKQMLGYHLNEGIDVSSRNMVFINRSVKWIVSTFNVRSGTKIADFGCGPGLYTTRVAENQADVTGIDFSKNSIQYAREIAAKKGLNIHYVLQNYLDFETEERFDLILMIMCDFCALSPAQRKDLLAIFLTILKPGGSVLLDVYSPTAFDQREEATIYEENLFNGFWSPNKYFGFLNTFKYEQEKVVLDKYTIVESDRIKTVYNWLQYFTVDKLKKEFVECGLTIGKIYSDVAGTPYDKHSSEFAIVAQKS